MERPVPSRLRRQHAGVLRLDGIDDQVRQLHDPAVEP
jgi:hypothetical protein